MKVNINTKEVREFLDLGCEYSGTEDIVYDCTVDSIKALRDRWIAPDEVGLIDYDKEFATLDDFVKEFYTRIIDKVCNVLESYGE